MGCVSCFHNLLWCIIHLSAPAMSCPEAVCRFLGGPSPSLPTPQLGDRATELFHREMLARGAVCCLPPPATPFICLLPPLLRSSSAPPAPEGWGWASFRDADGFFFHSANSVKLLSFERAGVGKELFRLQQKSISQIQYLCNEGTVVGITHPSMGQCLQGKQSEARLPRVLIIVLLAAWGKALGLERSNLVADICLPVNVAVADPIPSHLSFFCGIAWHMHGSVMFSGCQCLTLGKV